MELNIETINNHKMGGRVNIHFSKTDLKMAKRHIKRCSTSLIIREMQSKIYNEMGYHLTPVRKTIIIKKNWQTINAREECGEMRTLLHCWWVQTDTGTMENCMEVP